MTSWRARRRIYDRDGKPISFFRWAELNGDDSYRQIALDNLDVNGEAVEVSTVWLGLDHNHFGSPPIIYETMIFGGTADMFQDRYSTVDEAREGHARAVRRARMGLARYDEVE